jgi:hypothetical protein
VKAPGAADTAYAILEVLSPGPAAVVALARGPGGVLCIRKTAAIARGIPAIRRETAVLRALAGAGVEGVPRVLAAWEDGVALERLAIPTLRQSSALFQSDRARREAIARGAFAVLAAVHGARDAGGAPLDVVHGDPSPDNLYAGDARVALADFGLATWRGTADDDGDGAFRGTLLYAAPEVARGERADARADDFALAASLLHVATGIALREVNLSPPAMLVEAGSRPLDALHPWRALAPALFDPALATALLACLAFDPRDRPRETPAPC